jgi:mono/diheme cytochrome c family protein
MKSLNKRRGLLATVTVLGLFPLMSTGAAHALDDATQIALGKSEYMGHCASCHGAMGMGDGPVAEVLSTKPNDLTRISANYAGTFPADHIYQVIDGQKMINPHGDREMPVWGPRYWMMATEVAGSVPHDVDTQAMVHGRISALVKFLESIQAE